VAGFQGVVVEDHVMDKLHDTGYDDFGMVRNEFQGTAWVLWDLYETMGGFHELGLSLNEMLHAVAANADRIVTPQGGSNHIFVPHYARSVVLTYVVRDDVPPALYTSLLQRANLSDQISWVFAYGPDQFRDAIPAITEWKEKDRVAGLYMYPNEDKLSPIMKWAPRVVPTGTIVHGPWPDKESRTLYYETWGGEKESSPGVALQRAPWALG